MAKPPEPIQGTPIEEGEKITPEAFAEGFKDTISDTPSSSTPKPTVDEQAPSSEVKAVGTGTGAEAEVKTEVGVVLEPKPVVRADSPVEPNKAPPFKIQSNVNIVRHLRALFYAEYGTGKTILAGSTVAVPEMRDVLMISAEMGELTLFDPDTVDTSDPFYKVPFDLIDIVQVNDYKTTARVYDFLKLHCSARDKAFEGDPVALANLKKLQARMMPGVPDPNRIRLYRSVLIDTITEVEIMCMQQLLGITEELSPDEEMNNPEWAEYNKQRQMIHRLIRNFRSLPMNVIYTCQRQFKENEAKRRIYGPSMTGKLSNEVQGFMDVVGHLVAAEPTQEAPIPPRRIYVQPGPRHAAKNRFRRFRQPFWENPTIFKITEDVGLQEVWKKYGVY